MEHQRDKRKIDPYKNAGEKLPDGTPKDNDRIEIGPTKLAFDEWAAAGLEVPQLQPMRQYRLDRIKNEIIKNDYAAVLVFDPLNIRYVTDSTNMQLWNTHNPFRAALVTADGHVILWEYKNSLFLADHNPIVKEVRSGASMFYFGAGDKIGESAQKFAQEITQILRERTGNNKKIAVDKIMIAGLRALETQGLEVIEGEPIMEHARAIKGADEILAMKCAMYSCEKAIEEMEAIALPGKSEDEIWGRLHSANIERGGEWIETRLLASGPRTNPWFQECGPRIVQNNEILAFDTDLIGCYGFCSDISRTWFIGDGEPTAEMKEDFKIAVDHININMEMLKPGVSFKDLVFGGHQLTALYEKQKYSCRFHGVGLCDEWPSIAYPSHYREGAFEGELRPGMALCVEALVSREGGDFSIKLEDQVIITEDGYENITYYPWDKKLLG